MTGAAREASNLLGAPLGVGAAPAASADLSGARGPVLVGRIRTDARLKLAAPLGPILFPRVALRPPGRETLAAGWAEGFGDLSLAERAEGGARLAFEPAESIRFLIEERHHPQRRPVHSRLPFHYHAFPRRLRFPMARLLSAGPGRAPAPPAFPAFPLDASVEWLRGLPAAAAGRDAPRWRWPEGKRYALALTHDVDSARGLRAVERFVTMLEKHGLRGAFFVVAHHYPVDRDFLADLAARGHEIGVHGWDHRSRTPFLAPAEIDRRLAALRDWGAAFGAEGYRAPSLVTTDALFEGLGARFGYDSSVPTTEPWSLVAAARGCCTVLPHWRGACLELPLTLPMDDKLLRIGLSPEEIARAWRGAVADVKALGGLAMLSVHTEPHLAGRADLFDAYEGLVAELAEDADAWRATPKEIAAFWRAGAAS